MKVLVACEESQEVCKAFREKGHEAYSCDILKCSGGHPEWHIRYDAVKVMWNSLFWTMDGKQHNVPFWDMIIAFPPCTNLCVSGARWFRQKRESGEQQKSIDFFMEFAYAPARYIAIENPIGIMSTEWRKPDQIIQPWMFGHPETKSTCLWLFNLPKLIPTNIVEGREQRIWKMAPGPERSRLRSKTYHGIALAMAEQWGNIDEPIKNQCISFVVDEVDKI